jgi:hypothetical protein
MPILPRCDHGTTGYLLDNPNVGKTKEIQEAPLTLDPGTKKWDYYLASQRKRTNKNKPNPVPRVDLLVFPDIGLRILSPFVPPPYRGSSLLLQCLGHPWTQGNGDPSKPKKKASQHNR